MFMWIADNAVTLITAGCVLAVIALAVRSLVRERKTAGKGGCTGNCATCSRGCRRV